MVRVEWEAYKTFRSFCEHFEFRDLYMNVFLPITMLQSVVGCSNFLKLTVLVIIFEWCLCFYRVNDILATLSHTKSGLYLMSRSLRTIVQCIRYHL